MLTDFLGRRVYSDAARRLSDTLTTHALAGNSGVRCWVAFRLSDGGGADQLYDTREDAMRHAELHPSLHGYIWVPIGGTTPRQAENFLTFQRQLRAGDMEFTDAPPEVTETPLILPGRY